MWLGIPFIYVQERLADTISISKIPSISIESSFSSETIIAAFISGLVPALISLYVIRQNNESVRYQQKQENKRHYSAHLRVVVSEYAYQLNKVKEIHAEWVSVSTTMIQYKLTSLEEKMSEALLELERFKVSLLISIPDDEDGALFKKSINTISEKLSSLIKGRHIPMDDGMGWAGLYMSFISDANKYLNK
ncbi:hypothetical protein FHK96_18500 [Escherichia coli]|uniref:hypothetical protein n=1 Tax=Escherichia coli TaxID=562 RepID=UPI0013725D99|nr:hypothetical protein [Escherichia coli]EHR9670930.1 hypothetical protein [Escherichia coli]EIA5675016.1 hypothetical protein [Escherichia coli]EJG2758507.1 hypothetical protein [Escherichia coli]NAS49348.1 hypothetical protein [Escherichia coli]HCN5124867.1 hypothetical protein [Escherichia coli]